MMHAHYTFGFWLRALSLILVLTALVYLRGLSHTRSRAPSAISLWHAVSFLVGLLLIWAALASPLAVLDHGSLTAHMVQHLLLMTFAPPLIWLGAPARSLVQGLPERDRRLAFGSNSTSRWMQAVERLFTHPVVCWCGAAVTLTVWHIPAAFMLALQSAGWHAVAQTSFLSAGLLFWWPVIRPWPNTAPSQWPILLYLFLATLPCDILSGFLVFCDRVVYPIYLSSPQPLGLSALEDQQCAGALMWTCVTLVYLIAGTVLAARLLSYQDSGRSLLSDSHTCSVRPRAKVA
ncbi:MAG TPA: cytochrome c oxidase assembly protein [Terriglobales bacterium]|nr:cytochrome c oxidase assembly protein [Terriglobales bacterium]